MYVRTFLAGLAAVIAILLLLPLLLACLILRTRQPLFGYAKAALRLIQVLAGLRVEVLGREHVDRNFVAIFMSNHLSFIDGPLLFLLIPRPARVILKKQIFRVPVLGQGMKFVGFVPVDRRGAKQGLRAIERAAELIKKKKYSFLIFPEGTRSRDGCLQPFKRGGFFLARAAGVPIIPVSIEGTFALMPRGRLFVKPGPVRVRFHPAVLPGEEDADPAVLMAETREAIASGLTEAGRT